MICSNEHFNDIIDFTDDTGGTLRSLCQATMQKNNTSSKMMIYKQIVNRKKVTTDILKKFLLRNSTIIIPSIIRKNAVWHFY